MANHIILMAVGYLIGSLPFGVIASRVLRGIDIRDYGSGSTGSTNVLRTMGMKIAIPVLFLDMGKSALTVILARLFSDSPGIEVAAAIAAIIGHNWPVFIGFNGGKGVAPGLGGLFILSPISGLVATIAGVIVIAIWRYVSLGSIFGACIGTTILIALYFTNFEPLAYTWYGIIATSLMIFQHKDNIQRLFKGEERKLGQPVNDMGALGQDRRR